MNFRLAKILFIFTLLHLFPKESRAQTCTAVASSNWTNTATWSCGHAPTCNDLIVIPAGYTVTISGSINLTGAGCPGTSIIVYGDLFMSGNASQLNLTASSSIAIYPGGTITTDISNNSQKIFIGTGPAEWNSADGNINGPWIIANGSSNGSLPIKLDHFTAECVDEFMHLNWQTLAEVDNAYIILQKSTDAINWFDVAKFQGTGSSQAGNTYNYMDPASDNIVYYRLKQVGKDGKEELFRTVDAQCQRSGATGFDFYPNPATSDLYIRIYSSNADNETKIICSNTLGENLFQLPFNLEAGTNTFHVPIHIPDGLYTLTLQSGRNKGLSKRMVIIN